MSLPLAGGSQWLPTTCNYHIPFLKHLYLYFTVLSSEGEESACIAGGTGDAGSIPGSGRSPGEGNDNPLQYSCLGKFHGQRSLAGRTGLSAWHKPTQLQMGFTQCLVQNGRLFRLRWLLQKKSFSLEGRRTPSFRQFGGLSEPSSTHPSRRIVATTCELPAPASCRSD